MPPAMAAEVVPQVAGEIGAGLRWMRPPRTENSVPSIARYAFDVIEAVVLGVAEPAPNRSSQDGSEGWIRVPISGPYELPGWVV